MTKRPITLDQWASSDDADFASTRAILTFSNGTAGEGWLSVNCYECLWWDIGEGGKFCAFESALMFGTVTPALATLFGWTPPTVGHHWHAPQLCPFFRDRDDDTPEPDTDTLPLFPETAV